jgi:hypothetical protein
VEFDYIKDTLAMRRSVPVLQKKEWMWKLASVRHCLKNASTHRDTYKHAQNTDSSFLSQKEVEGDVRLSDSIVGWYELNANNALVI